MALLPRGLTRPRLFPTKNNHDFITTRMKLYSARENLFGGKRAEIDNPNNRNTNLGNRFLPITSPDEKFLIMCYKLSPHT